MAFLDRALTDTLNDTDRADLHAVLSGVQPQGHATDGTALSAGSIGGPNTQNSVQPAYASISNNYIQEVYIKDTCLNGFKLIETLFRRCLIT